MSSRWSLFQPKLDVEGALSFLQRPPQFIQFCLDLCDPSELNVDVLHCVIEDLTTLVQILSALERSHSAASADVNPESKGVVGSCHHPSKTSVRHDQSRLLRTGTM